MPTTITSYTTFSPGTKARSSQVNGNFSNHRGTLVPIHESSVSALDLTYSLGTTEYAWLNTYTQTLKLRNSGFHLTLQSETLTANTTMSFPIDSGGLKDGCIGTSKVTAGAITPIKMAAANYKLSASSGNYNGATNAAFADITNLSSTLTSSGRPIRIELVSDGGGSVADIIANSLIGGAYDLRVKILRDSTEIYRSRFAGNIQTAGSIAFPPSSINMIDVGAGATTYVYKIQAADTGGAGFQFNNVKLLAFEVG